jgi:hypothetical protein
MKVKKIISLNIKKNKKNNKSKVLGKLDFLYSFCLKKMLTRSHHQFKLAVFEGANY